MDRREPPFVVEPLQNVDNLLPVLGGLVAIFRQPQIRRREIELPSGIAGIGLGEALGDAQAVAIASARSPWA